jgi:hypothetical protein
MVYFQTKNPNLGKFWKVLQWKMLPFFSFILSILRPNVIFYGHFVSTFKGHLVYFSPFWYVLVICTEKNLATLDHVPRSGLGSVHDGLDDPGQAEADEDVERVRPDAVRHGHRSFALECIL